MLRPDGTCRSSIFWSTVFCDSFVYYKQLFPCLIKYEYIQVAIVQHSVYGS